VPKPKRVSLSQREATEAQGRRAFDASEPDVVPATSTDDRQRSTVKGGPSTDESRRSTVDGRRSTWEASHSRVTFYCPDDLLAAVEREIDRSGRSKSRVIVDALREHLGQ
jgi:Ribbon-helix-helix protein, copG family